MELELGMPGLEKQKNLAMLRKPASTMEYLEVAIITGIPDDWNQERNCQACTINLK